VFTAVYRILRTALHDLRRNLMRSALTCLGIMIGIASVIAMAEIGEGTSQQIQDRIASMGANQINVDPNPMAVGGVSTGAGTGVTLTPEDCDALLRECPTIRYAAPSVDCHVQVIYGNKNWSTHGFKGTTPQYLLVRNWTDLSEGAPFTETDVRRAAAVCILGQTVAHELFGDNVSPIGKEIRAKDIPLKVVGVLSRKGADMMGHDQDDFIIAPWTTVKYRITGTKLTQQASPDAAAAASSINSLSDLYPSQQAAVYPTASSEQIANYPMLRRFNDLNDIYISARSTQELPLAMEQIRQVLRARHHLGPRRSDRPPSS
jgi:ABC-type antimicrobial peptide transport system permease subunit